ncbi:LCP family protein [Corynebacterium pseudopelargi]|uniref:Transcriptional regulator YvhJ n=1 Tax=Corynebacterium pseudopelargi TaxID=2080757 RepID=A0A3G6IRP1_9CORY|nr:LCP family protein [Corynebacterium pseudopelargi]AZA08251.1 Putative transcriptional regulator YvhJ [Corynebacterium pseudopelargi]
MSKMVRRLLIAVVAVIVVLGLVAVAGFFWVTSGLGVSKRDPNADTRKEAVYLVMIRDTRAGGNADLLNADASANADVGRTDAMVLARVLKDQSIDLVSIPRDTLVDIPACERSDGTKTEPQRTKINAAYALGAGADGSEEASEAGMRCAERAVTWLTGFSLGGSVVLDSKGVEDVVDQLGGVELCATPEQAAAIPGVPEGCHMVDGQTAFNFSRARKGVDDGSDLARIQRQQQLLKAVIQQVRGLSVPQDVPTLLTMAHDLSGHMLATEGVVTFSNAQRMLSTMKHGSVNTQTIPVNLSSEGGNVVASEEAKAYWRAFSQGTPLPAS